MKVRKFRNIEVKLIEDSNDIKGISIGDLAIPKEFGLTGIVGVYVGIRKDKIKTRELPIIITRDNVIRDNRSVIVEYSFYPYDDGKFRFIVLKDPSFKPFRSRTITPKSGLFNIYDQILNERYDKYMRTLNAYTKELESSK